jgi:CBS domain-containing membrane protein
MNTTDYFKSLKVEKIMVTPVTCAHQYSSLKEIMDQLMIYHFHGLPIIDDPERVIGMVSTKDIMKAVYQGKEPSGTVAKEVMTNSTITAEPDSTVYSLIKVMVENEITRVPICKDQQLIGIVCQSDIVKNAIEPGIRYV